MKRDNYVIELISKIVLYIEQNIKEKLDIEIISKEFGYSKYHFQRLFSFVCGITLGDYIRKRKISLASIDLLKNNKTVTDVAYEYNYENIETFSRIFKSFHNVVPSRVKNKSVLNYFAKLEINKTYRSFNIMKFCIKELNEKILVGYKKHFIGVPYGEERTKQEIEFRTSTRAKQWLLLGASQDYTMDYNVITNVNDEGYDFYICYDLDESTREDLFNKKVTGVDFIEALGFETITIPSQTYIVFETEKKKRPIADYLELRETIVRNDEIFTRYKLVSKPEITAMHWRPKGQWENERYIEILLPIEKI